MTVCFLVGYRRLSLLVCQLLSVTGTAMIGAVVYLTYPSYGLLFVPAVCVIAFLFPLSLAIAQTCWMVVCFGVAVWVADPAGFAPLGIVRPVRQLCGVPGPPVRARRGRCRAAPCSPAPEQQAAGWAPRRQRCRYSLP